MCAVGSKVAHLRAGKWTLLAARAAKSGGDGCLIGVGSGGDRAGPWFGRHMVRDVRRSTDSRGVRSDGAPDLSDPKLNVTPPHRQAHNTKNFASLAKKTLVLLAYFSHQHKFQ